MLPFILQKPSPASAALKQWHQRKAQCQVRIRWQITDAAGNAFRKRLGKGRGVSAALLPAVLSLSRAKRWAAETS